MIVNIAADSVTPSNNLQSLSFPYHPSSTVTWTTPRELLTGTVTISGIWSVNVGTTFTSSDILVTASVSDDPNNYSINLSISNFVYTVSTREFSFRITRPSTGRGFIRIDIPEYSVIPVNNSSRTTMSYGPDIATVSIAAPIQDQTNGTITYRITWTNATSYVGFVASEITTNLTITGLSLIHI